MKDSKDQFETLKEELYHFLEERNWLKYHTPKNIAMSIAIEAAELMELFQWKNPPVKNILDDTNLLLKVEDELADILIYSISLARILNIDLFTCIKDKMNKNDERFPPNNSKLG
ncbi:MAG: nucleotide pyrophosphohydrolase [Asgard group archaeon]|nr:nucleotide pyrophosphohydrolase [Asgard group archaeon]